MQATIKDLQRNTGRITEAITRRETVHLTRHGESFAEMRPAVRGMSGAEFKRRWSTRTRLDKATCDEALAALKAMDAAR